MKSVNLHLFLSPIRNETRLLKEAKALRDLKLFERVVVIGLWEPDLPAEECINNVLDVVRVKTLIHRWRDVRSTKIQRLWRKMLALWSFLEYMVTAVMAARRIRPRYVSCHNLILLPVAWIATKVSGGRLVYVPHELEVERTGLTGIFQSVSKVVERVFIGACHKVVVVCQPIADWYNKRYALTNVLVVRSIPEVGRTAESAESRVNRRATHGLPRQGRIYIYQGVLDRQRGIDDLMDVFQRRQTDSDHLLLMGYGEGVPRIKDVVSEFTNIHFLPAVPVSKIVDHTALADIGVFCLNDPLTLSYQYSLPNKFFEYLSAGLPVIVSPNLKLLSKLVLEHQLGWVSSINDLASLMHKLTDSDVAGRKVFVKEFVESNTWESEKLIYGEIYL